MTIFKKIQILKPYHQPHNRPPKTGLTKQWRGLLKVMARHMGQGGTVKMTQHGEYADVELLP